MKKQISFIVFLLYHCIMQAEQFLYPIADFDNGNQLAVIYQKSVDTIELWFWDIKNNEGIKGLSTFLIPADVCMLPSGRKFSFIDQGYIKIKSFSKRSPKTLAIYEPISLFSSMRWIDENRFYFVAKEGAFYQVFQGDDSSNIQRLTSESIDSLYPQKVGNELFCIKRNALHEYKITSQVWNPIHFNQQQKNSETIVIPESHNSLCFLHMLSNTEGFFLQAPKIKMGGHHDIYEFSCHHFVQKNDGWEQKLLFNFCIPFQYIHGLNRLYESIKPFLPNYTHHDYIYFSSYDQNRLSFKVYRFHIPTQTQVDVTPDFIRMSDKNNLFAPYLLNNKIYCGVIFHEQRNYDFTQQNLLSQLPFLSTNNKC